MASPMCLPLQEKTSRKNTGRRASDLLILFLLLSLLLYRLLHLRTHGPVWVLAFICESWFTFLWVLTMNVHWNPVDYKTYPDRLLQRYKQCDARRQKDCFLKVGYLSQVFGFFLSCNRVQELPHVDMFVTTADAMLEPPIITVNTVLSLLAVDYPARKLACYVSDDGGSPIIFYSLVEASKFAKLWVPFCKKYGVQVRAPFMYFSKLPEMPHGHSSDSFMHEWEKMKTDYRELCQKIERAVQKSVPFHVLDEFNANFSNFERRNHPSIVKVIWENKKSDIEGIPHLVYVSREKQPNQPHHFKAGAMNVLTRVSGVMSNAPFMLNVDCDMFVNNPQIVLHAMCLLLGTDKERQCAFVQCPQVFYGSLKDDPFGNNFIVGQEVRGHGIAGIQGPMYGGTGCFHRRKIIYGQPPDDENIKGTVKDNFMNGCSLEKRLRQEFGNSAEFINSVARTRSGEWGNGLDDLSNSIDAAHEVARCCYEFDTRWGTEVGWVYGSTTEDVLTGLKIHSMGWESVYCTPVPPAFLGCAPLGGPASLTQVKRWVTGLLEILVGNYSPLMAAFTKKLRFRQCLAYLLLNLWAVCSLPELCYAALPAYCLLTNTTFLPKVFEPAMLIPATLFVYFNLYLLKDYLILGLSARAWWNAQRMERITTATSCLFGILAVLLKLLGLSEAIFELTRKDQSTSNSEADADPGRFTFDASPIFVPGVALMLVQVTALAVGLSRVLPMVHGKAGPGFGEMICSAWVLLSFMPFVKGLFRKGSYGIPWPTILKALALALLFFQLCAKAA